VWRQYGSICPGYYLPVTCGQANVYHDFFTTFLAVIIPFAAKKNRIHHLTMDFTITGSMWHRVVEVGIGWRLRLSS